MAEIDFAQLLPPPNAFLCPITQEVMRDPVAAADGTVYERRAIEAWFQMPSCGNRSPITNEPLPSTAVSSVLPLRRAIEEYMQHRPELIRRELNRVTLEEVVELMATDLARKNAAQKDLQQKLTERLARLEQQLMGMNEMVAAVLDLLMEEQPETADLALSLGSPTTSAGGLSELGSSDREEPGAPQIQVEPEDEASPRRRRKAKHKEGTGHREETAADAIVAEVLPEGMPELFKTAETHWSNRKFKEAVAVLTTLKDHYDDARFLWGYLQIGGDGGVPKDAAQGLITVFQGIKQGNAAAHCYLGFCFESGHGLEVNLQKALEHYQASAQGGHALGQCHLGICYERGIGVPEDRARAAELFRLSTNQGNVFGQFHYGRCFLRGDGVKQDTRRAAELFRLASDQGNEFAQNCLAMCYELGAGVRKNVRLAIQFHKAAAGQGNKDAQEAYDRLRRQRH